MEDVWAAVPFGVGRGGVAVTFAWIYIIGGFLFFVGCVPVAFHYAQDALECTIALGMAMCCATMWPLALPIVAIVGIGKWLDCY